MQVGLTEREAMLAKLDLAQRSADRLATALQKMLELESVPSSLSEVSVQFTNSGRISFGNGAPVVLGVLKNLMSNEIAAALADLRSAGVST